MIATAQKCMAETRTLSYLLYPPLLDEVGLGSAINWYVQGFAQRSGTEVKLDIPAELPRLPAGHEILLFRVVQESLTNMHRHANSASADIKLEVHPNEVVLQVRDHGQGLPAGVLEQFRSGMGGGVGLRSMRERVKEVGGRFEIESDSSGTVIRAIVPLAAELLRTTS